MQKFIARITYHAISEYKFIHGPGIIFLAQKHRCFYKIA